MTKVLISVEPRANMNEWRSRVESLICTNGSSLTFLGAGQFKLIFSGDAERDNLSPQEVATFVRNFLDDGFEDKLTIF